VVINSEGYGTSDHFFDSKAAPRGLNLGAKQKAQEFESFWSRHKQKRPYLLEQYCQLQAFSGNGPI
jgi:hypothetical protein